MCQPIIYLNRKTIIVDCAVILAIGAAAQAAAFTSKMGRAIVCTDSYQYISSAEAILDPDQSAKFDMRKPGYPMFLAGVWSIAGQSMWSAVVANHILLSFLPVMAYGLGRQLWSRALGCLAAILLMARLQMSFAWRSADIGNWIMSEALYTFLLSIGLLLFFAGLRKTNARRWLLCAGAILGLAWLTRGAATAVIPVLSIVLFVVHRQSIRTAMICTAAFIAPLVACVFLECGLNLQTTGVFRTSTGTSGSCAWSYRMRAFQDAAIPDTPDGLILTSLLPERSAKQPFAVHAKDQWVAIARAARTMKMPYDTYDTLCQRATWDAVANDPLGFLKQSAVLSTHHLFRLTPRSFSQGMPSNHREQEPVPPSVPVFIVSGHDPFAEWSLPHLSARESESQVARMRQAGAQRAPFTGSGYWSVLAYWRTKPAFITPAEAMAHISVIWPGFAILLAPVIGLNRRVCWIMAAIYFVEAIALSLVTVTDQRYQSVWMVTDTVFAAALPTFVAAKCAEFVKSANTRNSTYRTVHSRVTT